MFGICFVMQYFMFFLVLHASRWGRESCYLLDLYCPLDVMLLLLFFLLILMAPWVGLWYVIVALPGHVHLPCFCQFKL